jgi:hypothetical protein
VGGLQRGAAAPALAGDDIPRTSHSGSFNMSGARYNDAPGSRSRRSVGCSG